MFTSFWLLIILVPLVFQVKYIPTMLSISKEMALLLRLRHFGWGIISIIGVLSITILLMGLFPTLRWGWLINLTGTNQVAPEGYVASWHAVTVLGMTSLGILFVMLLLPFFAYSEEIIFRRPFLESSWWVVVLSCLGFGLAHLVMGIPIAAAIALSFPGGIFYIVAKRKYDAVKAKEQSKFRSMIRDVMESHDSTGSDNRRKVLIPEKSEDYPTVLSMVAEDEAVKESTAAHAAHNLMLMSILLLSMLVNLVYNLMLLTSS